MVRYTVLLNIRNLEYFSVCLTLESENKAYRLVMQLVTHDHLAAV